jgi:hypothetical protein
MPGDNGELRKSQMIGSLYSPGVRSLRAENLERSVAADSFHLSDSENEEEEEEEGGEGGEGGEFERSVSTTMSTRKAAATTATPTRPKSEKDEYVTRNDNHLILLSD